MEDSTIDRKEMLLDPSNNVEVTCDRQVQEEEENTHFSAYPPAGRARPTTAKGKSID